VDDYDAVLDVTALFVHDQIRIIGEEHPGVMLGRKVPDDVTAGCKLITQAIPMDIDEGSHPGEVGIN